MNRFARDATWFPHRSPRLYSMIMWYSSTASLEKKSGTRLLLHPDAELVRQHQCKTINIPLSVFIAIWNVMRIVFIYDQKFENV
eukprot:m.130916 g.130916  ORF g.130916 m.130916 type:complete len:84 (-) comp13064_c0_seq1:3687-3938(-)